MKTYEVNWCDDSNTWTRTIQCHDIIVLDGVITFVRLAEDRSYPNTVVLCISEDNFTSAELIISCAK